MKQICADSRPGSASDFVVDPTESTWVPRSRGAVVVGVIFVVTTCAYGAIRSVEDK